MKSIIKKYIFLSLAIFIVGFLSFPNSASAAIARVQSGSNGIASNSLAITWGQVNTSGNLLVAVVNCLDQSGGSSATITAPSGWSTAVSKASFGGIGKVYIFYYENAPSIGFSATFTCSVGSSNAKMTGEMVEYSGVATSGSLDKTASTTGDVSTTAATGTTATTTQANELWVGGIIDQLTSGTTFSAPTNSFSLVAQNNSTSGGGGASVFLERIVSSTGAASSTVTLSQGDAWSGVMATFSAASSTSSIAGTVYTDEGSTTMGSGRTVSVSINGAAAAGNTTTASDGTYTISGLTISAGDVLTLYLDNNTEKGVTVTKGTGSNLTGINIFQNYLIARCDNSCSLTNSNLDTADNNGDSDITNLYSISGSAVTTASTKSLYIPSSQTYAPGGNVTVAGTFTNAGTYTTGTETLSLTGTSSYNFTPGSTLYNVTINGSGGTYTLQGNLTATSVQLSVGTLIDNAKTVTVNGNITINNVSNLLTSTGTWIQGANGNISNPATSNRIKSFQVANSVTSTLTGTTAVVAATLGTNSIVTGTSQLEIFATGNDFLNMGAGSSITGSGSLGFYPGNNSTTLTQKSFSTSRLVEIGYATSDTIQMTGNWTTGDFWMHGGTSSTSQATGITLDSNGYNLTISGNLQMGHSNVSYPNAYQGKILFSTGTHSISGNVNIYDPAGAGTYGYLNLGSSSISMGGNVDFSSITVTPGTSTVTLTSTSTGKIIMTGGSSFYNLTLNGSGGNWTLQDNATVSNALTITTGTLNASSYTLTLSGTGTVFSNLGTFTGSTSTINITDTSSLSKTFAGGGSTFYNLSITGSGTGAVIIQGSNTFNNITIGAPKTITFTSATTQTISGLLSCTGTSGNLITINASTGGSRGTLSKSSGSVTCDYLHLTDSAATGGAYFAAGANSIDNGDNTGWNFGGLAISPPPPPPPPPPPSVPLFNQTHFGIYQNDAALNLATPYAAQDTNYNVPLNTIFRVRFETANTGDASGNITRRLEFREDSGAWTTITKNTNNIRLADTKLYLDGSATSSILTATGTFTAGQGKDTGSDTTQISLAAKSYTEDEYSFKLQSGAAGHSYQLRITNAGTSLDSYTVTPTINVNAIIFDQVHFRIYQNNAVLNSATSYAAEDTNYNVPLNTIFRVRFEVANLGVKPGNITRRLEFREDSGAWTTITKNTNNIRFIDTTFYTDGVATVSRLTATGTFTAGQGKDTGSDTTQISLAAGGYTEDEYSLKLQSGAASHSYQLRITNAGAILDNYSVIPIVNNSDLTPPTQSDFNPVSGIVLKTATPILTFSLNERGDCRASTLQKSYDQMATDVTCFGGGGTDMKCFIPNLGSNGLKIIYTACQDIYGNKDTAATAHSVSYTLNISSSSYLTFLGHAQVKGRLTIIK